MNNRTKILLLVLCAGIGIAGCQKEPSSEPLTPATTEQRTNSAAGQRPAATPPPMTPLNTE